MDKEMHFKTHQHVDLTIWVHRLKPLTHISVQRMHREWQSTNEL